jgi:hypothetical protein
MAGRYKGVTNLTFTLPDTRSATAHAREQVPTVRIDVDPAPEQVLA